MISIFSNRIDIAAKVWRDVKNAKASIQLNEGSHRDHVNSVAQSDIGPEMMERVDPRSLPPPLSANENVERMMKQIGAMMTFRIFGSIEEDQRGEK